LVDQGVVQRSALPWTIFTSYLGATNVPSSYQIPAQSRIIAVSAFTNEVDTPVERAALSGLGGTRASEARAWLLPIRTQGDAAAKAQQAASDVAAIVAGTGKFSGPEIVGVMSDSQAYGL
jgi:hypothetical protein